MQHHGPNGARVARIRNRPRFVVGEPRGALDTQTDSSLLQHVTKTRSGGRHDMRINRVENAESAADFGDGHVMMNGRRDKDPSQAR